MNATHLPTKHLPGFRGDAPAVQIAPGAQQSSSASDSLPHLTLDDSFTDAEGQASS